MTAAYSNLRGRYRSLGRSFRISHITHRSAAYFRRIHSANYFPHFHKLPTPTKHCTGLGVIGRWQNADVQVCGCGNG